MKATGRWFGLALPLVAVLVFSMLVALMPLRSASADAPLGLVSQWSGEGNANDSVDGNHGTLMNGATFAPGKVGQAFSFDGVNDYVSIPDSPSLRPTNLTIEGWFQFSAVGGIRVLVAKTAGTGTNESYVIWHSDGNLQAAIGDAGGISQLAVPFSPQIGRWYHIAYTFDDPTNTHALYIDGTGTSGYTDKTIGYDSHPVTLGAEYENQSLTFWFAGRIDEIKIYNRALSATEAGPAKAVGEQIKETGRAVVRDIRFTTNSAEILPGSEAVLNQIVKALQDDSKLELVIEGHTDSVGGAPFNLELSRKRAEAVKRWLADKGGISEVRLTTAGYGMARPVADNANEEGRAQNRRVELVKK
jgi:outer membrane protein OmpA-like peptidoglycan-associated protein